MTCRISFLAIALCGWLSTAPIAGVQDQNTASIVGTWALNAELSSLQPASPDADGGRGRGRFGGPGRGDAGGRGGRGGGRGGPGGFGGGPGGVGGGRGGRGNPEDMQRRRDAMRAILDAPEQLTIVRTDSMVIMTTGDGRTTRLALDGSKIGDDSTGIERKSRAEGDRVVSEISGMPMGKIAETYAVDPATGRLIVELQLPGRDGRTPDPQRRVYDRSR